MATRMIAGVEGAFALTGHNAQVARWAATITQDVNDASGFGSRWRQNVGGQLSLSGEAAGYLKTDGSSATDPKADMTATGDQQGIAFTLTVCPNWTYTGTAIVRNIRVGSDVNGNATFACSFESTGTVIENKNSAT